VHKNIFFWLAFIWTALVIMLSLVSFSGAPKMIKTIGANDKAIHFVFYFVFVFLWGNYLFSEKKIQNKTLFSIVIVAVTLGGIMEIFQELFTEHRMADWYDMLANTIGAVCGTIALWLYKNKKK
jgi:VanZ family protein